MVAGGCFSWKREAARAGSAVTPGLENTAGGTPHTATPHSTALGAGITGTLALGKQYPQRQTLPQLGAY